MDMKNTLRNNVIVAVTFFVWWMIVDVIDVKFYKIPSYKFELQIFLSIIFLSFMIVNKNLMKTKKMLIRVIGIALISSIITSAWFVISVVMLLQFHLSIGGHL
jgi:predicted secreted protein